jgi:phosphate transport system permease protein
VSQISAANSLYRARRRRNATMLVVSSLALAFGLFWLVWILATLLYEGLGRTAAWPMPSPGA